MTGDNRIDMYGFQKWLQKTYGEQTAADYMRKMRMLKANGLTESTTSAETFNLICRLCTDLRGTETARMYKKSIFAYQKFKHETTGQRLILLDNIGRIRMENAFPRSHIINPPKKGLYLYKLNIPRCKNDKLKLALMLQLNAGLRVGEVTALTPDKVTLGKNTKGENTVWLNIDPSKTQYGRNIRVLRIPELFDAEEIYERTDNLMANGWKMPSSTEMRAYMGTLDRASDNPGGATHDLRKYCARALYRNERMKGKNKTDSAETVRKQLGHRSKEYTIGEKRDNGGYIGKVWLMDKGKRYRDKEIDWRTP